jgi:general secretion pathway protein M
VSWWRAHRRSAVLVGVTLLLPLLILLRGLFGVVALATDYASERARIEPRIARLQGLMEREEALREASDAAQQELRAIAYAATQDATVLAASLQADVRQIMDDAGLSVSNSQVMPAREDQFFEQVAVKLTVSGSLEALDSALIGIAAFRPQLLVESLDAFPARQRERGKPAQQNVTMVLQLMALRQLPR